MTTSYLMVWSFHPMELNARPRPRRPRICYLRRAWRFAPHAKCKKGRESSSLDPPAEKNGTFIARFFALSWRDHAHWVQQQQPGSPLVSDPKEQLRERERERERERQKAIVLWATSIPRILWPRAQRREGEEEGKRRMQTPGSDRSFVQHLPDSTQSWN